MVGEPDHSGHAGRWTSELTSWGAILSTWIIRIAGKCWFSSIYDGTRSNNFAVCWIENNPCNNKQTLYNICIIFPEWFTFGWKKGDKWLIIGPCRKEVATKLAPGERAGNQNWKFSLTRSDKQWSDDSKCNLLKKQETSFKRKKASSIYNICAVSNTNVTKYLGFKNFTQWAHFGRISVESGQCHSTSN